MSYEDHEQVSKLRHNLIFERYYKYLECLDDPNTLPVTVFNPLTSDQLEDLKFMRRVSMDLQQKKEEDMQKAAQAKAVEDTNTPKKEAAEAAEESNKE